jgi:MATE family multidrug resistance protein
MTTIISQKYQYYREEIIQMLKLAWPIIFGQLGIVLMGVADTIQVGHVEVDAKYAVSASGAANGIWITIAILGINTLNVIAPMVSKANAEANAKEVSRLYNAGMRVALIAASVCTLPIILMALNFDILRQEPKVAQMAIPYLFIITISVFPQFIFLAIRQLSDGLAQSKIAMYITFSAVLVNIIFNHLLINGIWFFPKLGLNGAGVATLLARTYMMVGIWIYVKRHAFLKSYLNAQSQVSTWPLVSKIFKIGIPTGFQGFFEIAGFALAQLMMGWISSSQQAAHMVAISPVSATYMMVTGVAAAGGIRVGAALGARNREAILMAGTTALLIGTVFMAFWCGVFLIFQAEIATLYINDKEVVNIAIGLLTIGGFFQLFDGIQAVSLGILRGIADVNLPTGITLVAYWGLGLPLGYVLAFWYNFEGVGLWIGLTAGLAFAAIFLTWRFYVKAKKMLI